MEKLIPPVNAVYVLLGVVFIIAALSLLVSVIMEMVALILNTRARTLLLSYGAQLWFDWMKKKFR